MFKMIIEIDNKKICVEQYDYIITIDNFHSQDIFVNIQLEFFKSLLVGNTIKKAKEDMIILEDNYIREYKELKYISLPLLWNKKNRKIIYENIGEDNVLADKNKTSAG
jgi:hypothetical protein